MRRNWVLVLLVALVAVIGSVLWLLQAGASPPPIVVHESIPMIKLQPAQLIRDTWPNAGSGETTREAPERVRADLPDATDDRVAAVTIEVVVAEAGQADAPAPFVEVALVVGAAGAPRLLMCAVADGIGKAQFDVHGGDDQPARAISALGCGIDFRLTAETPTTITLRLLPRAIVEGRVVDAAGRGIANADVLFVPWTDQTANPPRVWHLGHCAGDGSFRFGLQAGGRISAQHPDYATSAMYLVRAQTAADSPPEVTSLQLTLLSRAVYLPGRVLDADGRGIGGAEVEFRNVTNTPAGAELGSTPQRVRSREDGSFLVRNLAAGPVDFAARARGFGRSRGRLLLADNSLPLEVRLPSACTVQGVVTNVLGEPIAEALVTAGEPGDFDSATTRTGADGRFSLVDLPPGENHMSARRDANGTRNLVQASVMLAVGQRNEWNPVLAAATGQRSLRGVVVDLEQQPLVNWRVEMRGAGQVSLRTTTAEDGSFAFPVRNKSRCEVRVFAPDRPRLQFADELRRDVDPAAGPLRIVVDPRLRRAALRGRVMTYAQEAVPADIECWHQERAEWVRFRAESDGDFVIAEVPAGTLDVVFRHPGQCGRTLRDLKVASGEDLDLGLVTLGAAGMLSGQITDAQGQAPESCELFVVVDDERISGEYSAGSYRFAAVPPGEHTLHVQGPTLSAATFPITITAGVELEQPIKMKAGVPLRFRVIAPPGAGPVVSLAIRRAGETPTWTNSSRVLRADDDSTGEVTFEACMAPGTYDAIAWGRGGHTARRTVVFPSEDDQEVHFELTTK